MNRRLGFVTTLLGSALLALVGCAADATPGADDALASATQEQLAASAARLAGAYRGLGTVRPPSFIGLVLEPDGRFFADVDTGIRCVREPCPSFVRLTGSFAATDDLLRLSPAPGAERAAYHGDYRYEIAGGKLTLRRADSDWGTTWTDALESVHSYCAEAADCDDQSIASPMCYGAWACDVARTCSWRCDVPEPVSVWPADRTKLVAVSAGGGFTPPPPSGSTCAFGAGKYTVDFASGELSWEVCSFVDWGTPMRTVTGSRTLSAHELELIDEAMRAVKVTSGGACGADKPLLTIEVTSASEGTRKFFDDFYACMDPSRTYVSNIDVVFSVLHDLAR